MFTPDELKREADALAAQAQQAQGEAADELFEKAGETYLQALSVNPEFYPALNAWAVALMAQAQMKPPSEACGFLDQAVDKLHQAEVISPGSGSYNLACIAALRGLADECHKWLENGPIHGKIPRRSQVEKDPDLSTVRDEPWFRTFLEKVDE